MTFVGEIMEVVEAQTNVMYKVSSGVLQGVCQSLLMTANSNNHHYQPFDCINSDSHNTN